MTAAEKNSPMRRLLHLRYKPKREKFQECDPCPAFEHFDWVLWAPDARLFFRFRKLRPRYVLCLSHRRSLWVLKGLRFLLKDVTLVVAGEDTHLGKVKSLLDPVLPRCDKVYFESKDIEHHGIKSFSMGFISYYLKRLGEEKLTRIMLSLDEGQFQKEGVLAAWGAIWGQLDQKLPERGEAARFVENSPWLKREELAPEDYLRRLAESEYLLAPAGQGIQAPKLAEAWLMRTIPIVVRNPCFEDMESQGYPFVMLDKWSDLTPERLEEDKADRFPPDWKEIERMLTTDYFVREILGQAKGSH
jgi:hypothetical protein